MCMYALIATWHILHIIEHHQQYAYLNREHLRYTNIQMLMLTLFSNGVEMFIWYIGLTHCGLVTSYGIVELGHHWLRWLSHVWRQTFDALPDPAKKNWNLIQIITVHSPLGTWEIWTQFYKCNLFSILFYWLLSSDLIIMPSDECHGTLLMTSNHWLSDVLCRQETSHYLSQCWPISLPPQWVKKNRLKMSAIMYAVYGVSESPRPIDFLLVCPFSFRFVRIFFPTNYIIENPNKGLINECFEIRSFSMGKIHIISFVDIDEWKTQLLRITSDRSQFGWKLPVIALRLNLGGKVSV